MSTDKESLAARKVMDEIYGIREKIYEKIKDMSSAEQVAYFMKSTEQIEARLGVKFKRPAPSLEPALAER